MRAAPESAEDSVQIVNETKTAEEQAEQPASTTDQNQQGAADKAVQVADGGAEHSPKGPENEPSSPTETTPTTVTEVDV